MNQVWGQISLKIKKEIVDFLIYFFSLADEFLIWHLQQSCTVTLVLYASDSVCCDTEGVGRRDGCWCMAVPQTSNSTEP